MKNKVYLLFSPLAAVQNTISNLLENYLAFAGDLIGNLIIYYIMP
jgi:hypothetical protein